MSRRDTVPYYLAHSMMCLVIALVAPFVGCGDDGNTPISSGSISPETPSQVDALEDDVSSTDDSRGQDSPLVTGPVCLHDQECQSMGAWHGCVAGRCAIQADKRTLLLTAVDIEEPEELGDSLGGALDELVDLGHLNLLVHLGETDSWLIQGVESGSVDGQTTYGQSSRFGSFCGDSEVHCADGICSTQFQPQSNGERLSLYVRDRMAAEDEACAYQTLELLDVSIDVRIDLNPANLDSGKGPRSIVTLSGLLPESIARDFVMRDGDNLIDVLRQRGMEMNGQAVDGSQDGWRLQLIAEGSEVFFDNDPGDRFVMTPANPTRGSMSQSVPCR